MSRSFRTLFSVFSGAILVAPFSVQAQDVPEGPPTVVPEVRRPGIQPGDRITLTIYNQAGQELSDIGGERTVDNRGLIYLPFLADVQVQGMDPDALRDMLDQRYEDLYSNSVVETVVEYRVSVTGIVRQSGRYYLDPTSTIIDALSAAGGSGSEVTVGAQGAAADPSRVQLTRRGYDQPITLNLRPFEADSSVLNARIQSGDWFFVPPARRSRVREDILFFGNIVTVLLSAVSLVILIGQ